MLMLLMLLLVQLMKIFMMVKKMLLMAKKLFFGKDAEQGDKECLWARALLWALPRSTPC